VTVITSFSEDVIELSLTQCNFGINMKPKFEVDIQWRKMIKAQNGKQR
jgi:hypothetical protein